ncbi:RNA-binding protein 20 isoform X1 [Hippoglossus stenolepis]|uniref:RNA-binding protein 20 isoform X1 n=2 Tax=Hippoglossus stenolepis TaxID=195615 RepID=UPI00159C2A77|nr:RNA-binding protein 20 isoform X1 [Hippoglossus stenolepis]
MQQSWDRTSSTDTLKKGHTKMLGKGQSGGYPPETTGELLQSLSVVPVDPTDKKGLQVGGQFPGCVPTGPQQYNQQLLLTPASLQLAQLQAQLTLQRLKLAQGGNTATAAALLNQVLSNVAMSQPLFNQLRTSAMVGNQQGAFPTGVLGFPSSNSALGALVAGGFHQNPESVRLNHPGGGGTVGQQGVEYGKKTGSAYPSDTDRRLQYNQVGGTSAASATAGDGQFTVINTQAKNMNNVGFQSDFYRQDMQGQQAVDQNMHVYNSTGHKEQWKSPAGFNHTGKGDMVSNAANVWTSAGQPIRSRTELYNPEEPTSDPKFNHTSGVSSLALSGMQGFGGYQTLHGNEETLSSGTRKLQPYQVNDYHAVTPTQLPHQCSICDKKVYNLKDWDQHVKGKLHLQNRTLYSNECSTVVSAGAVHYSAGRPSDGALNPGGTNSMVYSASSQDVSSGASASYLPAAAMKTYPMSDSGFASHQPESKPFPPRKETVGRVVHICNLPEGSCTENDVINLGLPFGKVTNYILMRSTHQAFLEMAYIEAAQAMVQYYQLTPATISDQKLLIRMSKRYKELQLKKPGKDVQTIIHDITSQRERDEMQELEQYMPERPRSRSPITRSLSPHSHSPSFTSCSSAPSPQAAAGRGPERSSNGLGPCRGSWEWSSHIRRSEDERERDDPWRNGGSVDDDRPNGRAADRRKAYQKPMDHMSSRSADERGGGGGGEGMRGNRDWHPRGSPQGGSFNSYRNMEDDFYMKEQAYKSDKPPRPPYQRHDTKSKRRDCGDYHSRSRHNEFEMSEEPLCRTPEEKRHSSPGRSHSKKTSRRHTAEKHERENTSENTDRQLKEKSVSPQQSSKPKEAAVESNKDKDTEKERESGADTDEECWYPKNMEELVTVDEVGGEDDSIIEPDLPELEEDASCPKETAQEDAVMQHTSQPAPTPSLEVQETNKNQEKSCVDAGDQAETPVTEKLERVLAEVSPEEEKLSQVAPELPVTNLSDFPSEEFKAALEVTHLEDKVTNSEPLEEPMENHVTVLEDRKTQEVEEVMETITNGAQLKDGILKKEIEACSPTPEQDKAVSEHSIPLGVEFIVPRTGFYCKLCGLFYTSEENAKTSHCRSTVHYRNLQKYLSQLAVESLSDALSGPTAAK